MTRLLRVRSGVRAGTAVRGLAALLLVFSAGAAGAQDGVGLGTGSASCTLADTSTITLITSLPFPPFASSGTLDIQCGDLDPETNRAECTCDIDVFDPLEIGGVGFVCNFPAPGCPVGFIDCSGADGGGAGDIPACRGDCDESGDVDISEVVTSANIALQLESIDACPTLDANGSDEIEIDEVVGAVGNLLEGCPGAGGGGIDVDLVSKRAIGVCTSNEDCGGQCEAYCAADDKVPTDSGWGCEGFCDGGDRAGQPCVCDTAGAGTGACANPDALDCPGGACNGPDGVGLGNICECQCISTTGGEAPPPGGMQCNLGSSLIVERPAGVACDGEDILITVGTRCIPLTTGLASSVLLEANPSGSCAATNVCVQGPNAGNSCTETSECSPMCAAGENMGNVCETNADCPGSTCVGQCRPVFCVTDEQCAEGDTCQVTANPLGPVEAMGAPAECSALGSGSFSGTQLRGVVNFFGSTIGDIVTQVNSDCL